MSNNLELIKHCNVEEVITGDEITYKLMASNVGDKKITNIILKDILAPSVRFIDGSVFINGHNSPKDNIVNGINIGELDVGERKTISFKSEVINDIDECICNSSVAMYNLMINEDRIILRKAFSNEVSIEIKKSNVEITQLVDKNYTYVGDRVTYILKIENKGDMEINYINLIDSLSDSVSLVEGSFLVDNIPINGINLSKGYLLTDLKQNARVRIQYTVQILEGGLSNELINIISADICYKLYNDGILNKSIKSNKTSVRIKVSNFKEFSIDKYLTIPSCKDNLKELTNIEGNLKVVDFHVLQGSKGISNEGQRLTGYQLVVSLDLELVIEYITEEGSQGIHSSVYNVPISNFIVISSNYFNGSLIDVNGEIKSMYFKKVNNRTFYINSNIFLIAKQ